MLTPINQNSSALLKPHNVQLLKESADMRKKIDDLLFGCFMIQRLYGKEPESYEIINSLFHELLADYRAESVAKALKEHMRESSEFPTPADIIQRIERPKTKISAGIL